MLINATYGSMIGNIKKYYDQRLRPVDTEVNSGDYSSIHQCAYGKDEYHWDQGGHHAFERCSGATASDITRDHLAKDGEPPKDEGQRESVLDRAPEAINDGAVELPGLLIVISVREVVYSIVNERASGLVPNPGPFT